MTRGSVVVAWVLCAGLAACSDSDEPVVGDEPITPEAVVAIAQEHVGAKPNRIWKDSEASDLDLGPADAVLVYDALSITVRVAETTDSPLACATVDDDDGRLTAADFFDGCVDETVEGHEVSIAWQDVTTEEDPGYVYVIDHREGEDVSVRLSGPRVTSDPRNLDLGVPLEDLAALVTDQRLSLTTSQEVVDLGDAVERAWG